MGFAVADITAAFFLLFCKFFCTHAIGYYTEHNILFNRGSFIFSFWLVCSVFVCVCVYVSARNVFGLCMFTHERAAISTVAHSAWILNELPMKTRTNVELQIRLENRQESQWTKKNVSYLRCVRKQVFTAYIFHSIKANELHSRMVDACAVCWQLGLRHIINGIANWRREFSNVQSIYIFICVFVAAAVFLPYPYPCE